MRIPNLARYLSAKTYKSHQALLLYGNDEGALQFHLDLLLQAFKQDGITIKNAPTINEVELGKEPGLFDDPNEQTLTVCRKVTGRDFKDVEKKLESADPSQKFIFVGPNLGSKIKMVSYFQTQKHVGSVPSYDVSLPLLREVIQSSLSKRSLTLPPEHINVLVETYSGSPISLMTDMEKLELYLKSNETITTQDLKKLINGSLKLNIDLLVEGFIERNKEKIIHHAEVSLLEAEPYLILRSLSRQMTAFCEFMGHLQFSSNPSQAMASMKTPLFFSTKPLFERASNSWTLKLAINGLKHLLLLEKRFKNAELSLLQFQNELCLYCKTHT